MSAATLVRGALVVTADDAFPADVLIRGEKIAAIGHDLNVEGAEVIDASGCYLLPGVIDPHVHIALDTGVFRTADDWRLGTATAALGGVTTVIDFATQFPDQDARQAVANRLREITDTVATTSVVPNPVVTTSVVSPFIDYALHCMLTVLPADDATLDRWMADLVNTGVSAIKIYTTYRPNYYQDDASLLRSMQAAARAGLVVMVHAENDALVSAATARHIAAGETALAFHGSARPALAEVEAVNRCLFLADQARCELYVVHCSVGRSVDLIAAARRRGQAVHAETCPQYLLLDERRYAGPDAWRFIMQPPLRDPFQPAHLWQWVGDGSVSALGTDHCDYAIAQKQNHPFTQTAGGLPGLQTFLPLMVTYGVLQGQFSWSDLVRMMSTNPARIFKLYPVKGSLTPGADADLVVYDPAGEFILADQDQATVGRFTPYAGMKVTGRVRDTFVRGRPVVREGRLTASAGWGRYIPARS